MMPTQNHDSEIDEPDELESDHWAGDHSRKSLKVRRREIRLVASQIIHAHSKAAVSPSETSRANLINEIERVYSRLSERRFHRGTRPLAIVIFKLSDSLADYGSARIRPELQTCEGVLAQLDGFIADLCRLMATDRDATIDDMPHTVKKITLENADMERKYAMSLADEFHPIATIKDAWNCVDYQCTGIF